MDENGMNGHGMDGTSSNGGNSYGVGSGGVRNGDRRRWAERPGKNNRALGGAGVGDDDDNDEVSAEGWREGWTELIVCVMDGWMLSGRSCVCTLREFYVIAAVCVLFLFFYVASYEMALSLVSELGGRFWSVFFLPLEL